MSDGYRTKAALVRPNPVLRYLGPTVIVASLLPLAIGVGAHAFALAAFTPMLVAIGAMLTVYGARTRGFWKKEIPGELSVEGGELRFGDSPIARRGEIKTGFVVPQGGQLPIVRLARRGAFSGAVDFRVRDEAHGREILRAVGMDATQKVAVFRLPSQAFANRYTFLRAVGLVIGLSVLAGVLAGAFHLGAMYAALFRPAVVVLMMATFFATLSTLTVGADGVLVEGLGARRFIRHSEIAGVRIYDGGFFNRKWQGVALMLHSGEEVRIVCNRKTTFDDSAESRSRVFAERIREAMESAQRGDPTHAAAMLGRNARKIDEWINALRGIGAGVVDLRTAPIPTEQLWRLVEDPAARATARAGAAVALGPSLDDDGRARVRVAAEATASPRLRVALEAATTADDAALAQALGDVEAEEASAGGGGIDQRRAM